MADSEPLKVEARKHVTSIRNGVQTLFSGGLSASDRIEARNALIKEFDALKKLFKQMNKLDGA
jgi:hypothetical protein